MGGVCGVAVESEAVRISYFRDGQRVEDSIDAEGAAWLLSGKLVDCGPFDDVVLTGRDADVVESLLASLDSGNSSTIRMVDEGAALLAYARSMEELADARSLLVLDLGRTGTSAFTLDVAAGVVTRSARRAALSGEALDDVVEHLVMAKGILPPAQDAEAEAEYRSFFRELKELITASAGVRAPGNGPMLLTRDEFDDAVTSTFLQTLAWAAPSDPDAVLLIGGGARIPLIKTLVEQEWTVPLVLPASPGSVIVEGAALEATPSEPHIDLAAVLQEHDAFLEGHEGPVLVADTDAEVAVAADVADGDPEPATTPIRVVTRTTKPKAPDVASESVPSRRRIRWSVRDAAGIAGVGAVVLLVWAVIFVRGDTPPPPGIGVQPVGTPTAETSIAEGVPTSESPLPTAEVPVEDPSGGSTLPSDAFETDDPDFGGASTDGGGLGNETGSGAGN